MTDRDSLSNSCRINRDFERRGWAGGDWILGVVSSPRISKGPAGCRINRDFARRGWATKTSHPRAFGLWRVCLEPVHTDTKAFMSCGHAKKEVRVGRGRTAMPLARAVLSRTWKPC